MVTRPRADTRFALAVIAFAALAVFATPLVVSIGGAVFAGAAQDQWGLWWPSVSLAAGAACVALMIGLLGYVASGTSRRGGFGWVVFAVTCACALPSYVHALVWSWALPAWLLAQGPLAAACVLGFSYAPVAFLVLVMSLRATPHNLSEAAWMVGLSPPRARLLLARRAVPSVFAAWLIAFLLSFSDFPVADYFRVTTYATEVFARVAAWLDPAAAGRLALPVLLTALVMVVVLTRIFRRLQTTVMPIESARAPMLTRWENTARLIAGVLFAAIVAGVPLVMLANRIPNVATLGTAMQALGPELPGTIALGLVVGIAAALLGATLAFVDVRRIVTGARLSRLAAWAALAWPASLVCLGAIAISTAPGLRQVLPEWLPMIMVLVLRWLVLSYELWSNFWMRMPSSLEESCWLVGMPWWQALAKLLWWHGGPAFGASVLLVACFSINDLTVFVLLAPPGFSTTTLNIFSAVHYGPSGYLAALCLCQALFVTLLAVAAVLLIRRAPQADQSTIGFVHAAS